MVGASVLTKKLKLTLLLSSTPHYHHFLLFSTQIQQSNIQNPNSFAQYLVSSLGFSHDQALKLSKSGRLDRIQESDQPDSVVCFLKETGLLDTQIKRLISWKPSLLSCSVIQTLDPKVCQLRSCGFEGERLVQLIRSNPHLFTSKAALSRLEFWRNLIGQGKDEVFSRFVKTNWLFLTWDLEKNVIPKINLLKQFGLSDKQIKSVMIRVSGFISRSPDSIRQYLEQTERFGFSKKSGRFVIGLSVVATMKKETIERKLEFFKRTCGWSEEEMQNILMKYPVILGLSEENVKRKMDFLVDKAGFNSEFLAGRPALLAYSLEKRLVPRHFVVSVLESKGLIKSCNIYDLAKISEKDFVKRFIEPNEKEAPELAKAYVAACAGKMPV